MLTVSLLLAVLGGPVVPLSTPFFDLPAGSAGAPWVLADGATRTFGRVEVRQEVMRPGAIVRLTPGSPIDQIAVLRGGALAVSFGHGVSAAHAGAVVFAAAGDPCELRNPGPRPALFDLIRFYPKLASTAGPAASRAVSQVIEWASLHPRPFDEGVRRSLLDAPTATLARLRIHATTLNPHAKGNPVHRHPWEELVIVSEGAMQALVGSERHQVQAGSACFELAGGDQTYTNPYDAPTTFYIIEAIPPGIHTR